MENLFYKNKLIKLLILDEILSGKRDGKLVPELLGEEFNVNMNTVKKALNELTELGYIETKKKSGTRVKYIPSTEKINNYSKLKLKFENIFDTAKSFGFSIPEILSCFVGAFYTYQKTGTKKKVIFVEKDYYNLWIGKIELENILNIDVIPMLLEDALKFLENDKTDYLIVTTYYCQPLLKVKNLKIFPLKITPPIEQLINFNIIPEDANIVVLTISEELKERLRSTYKFLQTRFRNLKFLTIHEILKNKQLISNTEILLTLKSIYNDYRDLFSSIKKVVVYSRFHDEEGIKLLKKTLEEKNLW